MDNNIKEAFENNDISLTSGATVSKIIFPIDVDNKIYEIWWLIKDGTLGYRILNTTNDIKIYLDEKLTFKYTADKEYNMAFGSIWREPEDIEKGWLQISLTFRPSNDDVGEVYIDIIVTDEDGVEHTVKVKFNALEFLLLCYIRTNCQTVNFSNT